MLKSLKGMLFKKNTVSGLISIYDPLSFSENTIYSKKQTVFSRSVKSELLDYSSDKNLMYSVYYMVTKDFDTLFFESVGIKPSIFAIKPGFIGREFNKTSSMMIEKDGNPKDSLFQVLSGDGYFLIENLDEEKEIILVKVSKGSLVCVPKNYSFVIINSSFSNNLVCISLIAKNAIFIENVLGKTSGAALYYTRNGFIKNSNIASSYKLIEYNGDYISNMSFDKEKGIYKECTLLPEKFKFLSE